MSTQLPRSLLAALLGLCLASLLHFIHNAEYLHEYPNLPESLTAGRVYAAWVGQTLIGLAGLLLFRRGWVRSGLALMGVYAGFGFSGLTHYLLAPVSAHNAAMHLSIAAEAAAGLVLLLVVAATHAARRRAL